MNKRLWYSLCINLLRGEQTAFLKKHKVFHHMGENCCFNLRLVPLYSQLIGFGNNVNVAPNVSFHTHDGVNLLLKKMKLSDKCPERLKRSTKVIQEGLGCIDVGDNVMIGNNVILSYGVKIGSNVIIAAGSVITKDVPSNSVVSGFPAEVVCSMDSYIRMRLLKNYYPQEMSPIMGHYISPELIQYMWDDFDKTHG